MIKNNKGFSIVELLAVILISSIIIWPLMTTLVGNVEVNRLIQDRRSSVAIATSALYGVEKMNWDAIDGLVTAPDYYVMIDSTTCGLLAAEDKILCDEIFASIFNNLTLDEDHYQIYFYDFYLDENTVHQSLINDGDIKQKVRDDISAIDSQYLIDEESDLLRVSVWAQYSDDPVKVYVISGVILK